MASFSELWSRAVGGATTAIGVIQGPKILAKANVQAIQESEAERLAERLAEAPTSVKRENDVTGAEIQLTEAEHYEQLSEQEYLRNPTAENQERLRGAKETLEFAQTSLTRAQEIAARRWEENRLARELQKRLGLTHEELLRMGWDTGEK